ncbi:MAG: hypothetical protein D6731_01515, partial [Planctomycetota bacterium]
PGPQTPPPLAAVPCARPGRSRGARLPWTVPVSVLALALFVRLPAALRGHYYSNDAAEYLLLARSLARGEGFVLPIRVRFTEPASPAVHSAFGERAPLWPLLLSLPARWARPHGWPEAWLQLAGCLLAALAALLACLLSADLARRRGLRGRSLAWAAFLGGATVAWLPGLLRASLHLWAEPLGLVLLLVAFRHWLGLDAGVRAGSAPRLLALTLAAGLARFARPELWVLVPFFCGLELARGRRRAALVLGVGFVLLNAVGVAWTGVLAPQLELFTVRHYTDLMSPAPAPPPSFGEALGGVLSNAGEFLAYALTPRRAAFVVPCALFALRAPPARPYLGAAAACALSPVVVWSTSDPSRFALAPLCLLAPVAAVEALALARRLRRRRRPALAACFALWFGVLGYAAARAAHKAPTAPGAAPEPWRSALLGPEAQPR